MDKLMNIKVDIRFSKGDIQQLENIVGTTTAHFEKTNLRLDWVDEPDEEVLTQVLVNFKEYQQQNSG